MPGIRGRALALASSGALVAAVVAVAVPAASAATTHSAGAQSCGNGSLAVTRTFTQGGAGHSWMALVYRNTTNRACTLHGYPGLDVLGGKGRVIAHAKRTRSGYGSGGHLGTVKIGPGKYASAGVEWLNFNGNTGGSCRFGHSVNTIAANTTRVHNLTVRVSVCELQVHPTVSGIPQYPHYGPAQHDWIKGSKVSAAEQGRYFKKAELELKATNEYSSQVKTLAQLRSYPDTGLTHKQIKKVRADVKSLNGFFATPGLYL